MELYTKKRTFRSYLNRLLRITQRVEITSLKHAVTIRNVYKNKQIIEVSSKIINRCYSKI